MIANLFSRLFRSLFSAAVSSVYQGALGCRVIVLDLNGANLPRAPNKVASYICKRESRPGVSSNNPA